MWNTYTRATLRDARRRWMEKKKPCLINFPLETERDGAKTSRWGSRWAQLGLAPVFRKKCELGTAWSSLARVRCLHMEGAFHFFSFFRSLGGSRCEETRPTTTSYWIVRDVSSMKTVYDDPLGETKSSNGKSKMCFLPIAARCARETSMPRLAFDDRRGWRMEEEEEKYWV